MHVCVQMLPLNYDVLLSSMILDIVIGLSTVSSIFLLLVTFGQYRIMIIVNI